MAAPTVTSTFKDRMQESPLRLRASMAFALAFVVFFFLARRVDQIGTASSYLEFASLAAITFLLLPLAYRWMRHDVLWRLRNKLVLTYLLFGLAPVVLFTGVMALAAYVAVGQFAIHLATARLDGYLTRLEVANHALANRVEMGVLVRMQQPNREESEQLPQVREEGTQAEQAAAFVDGQTVPLRGAIGHGRSPLGLPQWFLQSNAKSFSGMVSDGASLYMVAMERRQIAETHTLVTMESVVVDHSLMKHVAEGLGQVRLAPGFADRELSPRRGKDRALSGILSGGDSPPGANLIDIAVRFVSSAPVVQWDDGSQMTIPIHVESRPSLLYDQLFGTALSGTITNALRLLFGLICFFCLIVELIALWMAMRLNRTVTHSVESLYDATLRIDKGDLNHRIKVTSADQMADLCNSFNAMSSSLERLLQEQKEKERLQNELSIAQEVQANLFPVESVRLPSLELHGVCRPARSVSGDYYDFLQFHDRGSKVATGLGIALGDISGKGISAALLMATLHSAVRAYRFASEELDESATMLEGLNAPRGDADDRACGDMFQSPSRILSLLNRHLYRSTQPEKYATLFLAHYDVATRSLTYGNAGHLPPMLLRANGDVEMCDKGGTVVGLMDGMHYEEETKSFGPGDLLIAFSDGVTEPENDFGEFGEARLLEVVQMYRDRPLKEISAYVMEALDAWIGAEEQPDDITLVMARGV